MAPMVYWSFAIHEWRGERRVRQAPARPWNEAAGWSVGGRREPEDDFYCLRYRLWYPSLDCAFRTKFRTCPGCLNCEQGRFNLKRHADALRNARFDLFDAG